MPDKNGYVILKIREILPCTGYRREGEPDGNERTAECASAVIYDADMGALFHDLDVQPQK